MKHILFHIFNIFFLWAISAVNAQELKWSQPQKMTERGYITEVIGQNGDGIFIVKKSARQPERNITLEHYSRDMRLLHSKALASDKDEHFIQLLMLHNSLQLYYTFSNKESKEIELRVRHFDFKINIKDTDSTLVIMPGGDFANRKLQAFKSAAQQQTLLLYTRQSTDVTSNYNYIVLDTLLKTHASGEISITLENAHEIENGTFTNTHLALLLRETVKRKVNRQGYQYYICETKLGESSARQIPLFNDTISVIEGLIKADNVNNALVFGGLYSLKDSSYSKGYYIWSHTLQNDKYKVSYSPFPAALVQEMVGKTSKVHGIYNLRSGDMILRKDGGIVLTSEEYEETREAVMDMNMYGVSQTNFRYYFYYENMLILSINSDGGLDWHTVLRKEQVSVNDNGAYSSYSVAATADKLVYVYNDLSRKSWNLSLYEVNSDGTANNKIILRAQDYDAKLVPQYARQIAYNEVLIPGISRKGYVFLKLTL